MRRRERANVTIEYERLMHICLALRMEVHVLAKNWFVGCTDHLLHMHDAAQITRVTRDIRWCESSRKPLFSAPARSIRAPSKGLFSKR
ncbi:hypothetical protein PCAR4_140191 [Paraburkholderia caribensis]|nr:hypothetical protein PCAR4_140191 [Paraburkholderia caribensis]